MPPTMTLLSLDPDTTLSFTKSPGTSSLSKILRLTNSGSGNVAFKVKTTAPKAYLVRPSSGTLQPRESIEVQIILQGGDGRADHRFLVQAVAVPESQGSVLSKEAWQALPKEQIQEQRLNVVLEEAATTAPAATDRMSAPAPATVGGGSAEAPPDLQQKYDELVQYTLMLEKQKKKLETDLDNLKLAKGNPQSNGGGYTSTHIFLVAVIVFLISYMAKFLG
eukprot:TRINITY_DN97563_c0_g1_i1.p1 TRINITY_DN97563_c0_g1~~TRINITY_DN97563_c0_g1_i1.p1  ORF type:complete len:221 (+),score=59.07 TRINITY_DN97563_c0_g1_i1:83-745(+)